MNSLHCYLASEGLVFLKRGYLPFEMSHQLSQPWMHKNCNYISTAKPAFSTQDFHHYLKQQYKMLPDHLREMVSFEYFAKQSQSQRGKIEQAMAVRQRSLSQSQPFSLEKTKDWRILSLFKSWDNLPLWNSNSAAGEGLVIELDINKSGFNSTSYNDQAQHFSVVQEVDEWQPMDDLYYFFHRPERIGVENANEEWRLLRPVKAADRTISVQKASRAMYRLPTKAVNKIILGYCCSPAYCQQVKEYLSKDINYRHVQCVQAQLDPTSMRLEQVPV